MSRSDDTIQTGCGLVLWLALLYYLGKGYSYLLQKEYFNFKENWMFWVLIYPITLLILVLFIYGIFKLIAFSNSKYSTYKRKKIRCKHGVEGGETLLLCNLCNYEKDQKKRVAERLIVERQIQADILEKASVLKREELRKLVEYKLKSKEYLMSLSPRDFEDVISDLFRQLGYNVKQTPYSNDRGKDAVATKDNLKYVIECKHFAKDKGIGRPHIQKFFAALMEEEAEKGFFVTTSYFANTALEYANKNNIECINMDALIELMNKAYKNRDGIEVRNMCLVCGDIQTFSFSNLDEKKTCSNGHIVFLDQDFKNPSIAYLSNHEICERCGIKMKLIKGKRGLFWGCPNYPRCRNTKSYDRKKRYK